MKTLVEGNAEVVMKEYRVKSDTIMIAPVETENEKEASRVYEKNGSFIVLLSPLKIISNSCKYYGSTFKGRVERAKELTGYTYKTPIGIRVSNHLFFFPTHASSNKKCIWISHSWIKCYDRAENSKTKISFNNGITVTVPISLTSIQNQFLRTGHLRVVIENQPINKKIEVVDNFIVKEYINEIEWE